MDSHKRTRKEITHDRILDVASLAIRRAGYQGVGVADIMKEAGLTHGGYYAHFESREAMLAEAIERAGQQASKTVERRAVLKQARGASAFAAMVEAYLSDEHLVSAETGCPVAALLSEIPRQSTKVRDASVTRIQHLIESVGKTLPHNFSESEKAVIVSTMVGALQIARALEKPTQGKTFLAAVRQVLNAQYDAKVKESSAR